MVLFGLSRRATSGGEHRRTQPPPRELREALAKVCSEAHARVPGPRARPACPKKDHASLHCCSPPCPPQNPRGIKLVFEFESFKDFLLEGFTLLPVFVNLCFDKLLHLRLRLTCSKLAACSLA